MTRCRTKHNVKCPGCVLFDWGDTLMCDFPEFPGPMASWPRVEAIQHAREALLALRERGWLLALATNATASREADIWKALQRGGLDGLLDKVYCFDNVGHRKPSAAFFAFVLRDLGLSPAEMVMVGDDYETDVRGANGAGIRAVWFNPGSEEKRMGRMHRTIHDLASLPKLLECWDQEVDRTRGTT